MTRARSLVPAKEDLGRCEAQRETRYTSWWEKRHPDKQCMHSAKYEVEGKRLCAKHAGVAALRILLEEK